MYERSSFFLSGSRVSPVMRCGYTQEPNYDFMVAGIHYEGRHEIVRRYVHEGDRVFLARDRHNAFSRNAIEVRLENGFQTGYVPEEDARDLASLLDNGCVHTAYVKKILTGGRIPIPVIAVEVYHSDAPIDGGIREADIPPKRIYVSSNVRPNAILRRGCLVLLVCLMLAGVLLFMSQYI